MCALLGLWALLLGLRALLLGLGACAFLLVGGFAGLVGVCGRLWAGACWRCCLGLLALVGACLGGRFLLGSALVGGRFCWPALAGLVGAFAGIVGLCFGRFCWLAGVCLRLRALLIAGLAGLVGAFAGLVGALLGLVLVGAFAGLVGACGLSWGCGRFPSPCGRFCWACGLSRGLWALLLGLWALARSCWWKMPQRSQLLQDDEGANLGPKQMCLIFGKRPCLPLIQTGCGWALWLGLWAFLLGLWALIDLYNACGRLWAAKSFSFAGLVGAWALVRALAGLVGAFAFC